MRFRTPSKLEFGIQLILGFGLLLLVSEFANAFSAKSCFVPNPSPNCYPWGMTEGPMEGYSWSYANRENYLIAGAIMIGTLVIAMLIPFLVRRRRQGALGMLAVLVAGAGGLALCERVLGHG